MKTLSISLFCFGSLFASTSHADAPVPNGNKLYQQWCAACHAAGPGHPGTQALDALYKGATPAVLEEREDLQPATVTYFVRNGRSTMPSFRKTEITDKELEEIGHYLFKQGKTKP